jgi:membrane-anchored protein YejM (alkaline phosphatase superfamily)
MEQKNLGPPGVNYLYFGLFFILLCLTSTSSIFLKDNLIGSRSFFWFYAIGQAALEVTFFCFLGLLIDRFIGRLAFWPFIGGTFFVLLLHFFDFMMDRILDLSVWDTLNIFIFNESFDNFYYLLDASGVPFWAWCVLFAFVVLLPIFGMLLYKGSSWLTKKMPLHIKNEVFLQMFFCIPAALFLWDFSASKVIHPDAYTSFVKSLPWKRTFFQPQTVQLPLEHSLKDPTSEHEIQAYLDTVQTKPGKKPNIFLFVVESLRDDFIQPEIAPNLCRFRDENISADLSLSNANATNLSWFSIFHSNFPFYWQKLQEQNWNMGSPALALFKKMGYKIRVYSAAELQYYAMDKLLFGENFHLADSFQYFKHASFKETYKADASTLSAMQKDLNDPGLQEGQFIIIFWDGTHFDYSWPKHTHSKCTPFATEFAYFSTFCSQTNIELIRNRYRNAIHHIDSLFGNFLQNVSEDAIIAFTGDHGEEFFDHGHLFHCSHLVDAQTIVPIYLKLGSHQKRVPMMTQMDIMPTLLDASFQITAPFLEGESIRQPRKWPFATIARFNASRCPYEFCLHNGTNQVIFQFKNRNNIFDCTNLKILRLNTPRNENIRTRKPRIKDWIHSEFDPAFQRLFTKADGQNQKKE